MESPKVKVDLPPDASEADRRAADWIYGVISGVQKRYAIYLHLPISGEIQEWNGPGSIRARLRIRIKRDDLERTITQELVANVEEAEARLGVEIRITALARTGPL